MSDIFNVKNRSASMVGYAIPEDGIRREFMPGEVKKITKEELDKLSFQPGGREMMYSFLQIQDEEMLEELNIPAEPEYYLTESEIANLILNGSLDQFLDCLDFAPTGVIDLIKKMSIDLPINDVQKIEALKDKTGFDAAKALAMKAAEEAEEKESAAPASKERRTEPKKENKPQGRRTAPKYKVVGK